MVILILYGVLVLGMTGISIGLAWDMLWQLLLQQIPLFRELVRGKWPVMGTSRDVGCVTVLRVSPIESPLQIVKSRYTPIRHSTLLGTRRQGPREMSIFSIVDVDMCPISRNSNLRVVSNLRIRVGEHLRACG